MAAAVGQSYEIPIIIRILASLLYFCPYGSTILTDRHYLDVISSGTSADDPSAVADSYIRDWWNADSKPSADQNLQYEVLHQALDHHRHVTNKNRQLPPTSTKEKHTWWRDFSDTPRGTARYCENCRLYRKEALGLADNLNDIRNRIHGIELKYELQGNLSERRAAGFFQLYDGVLTKELNMNTTDLGKGKSKKSNQDKSLRVQELAAAELARLEALSSLKWTWGVDLSTNEAMDIGRHKLDSDFRQHSGYNISLPWGRRGQDSAEPSSFPSSQVVSDIGNDTLEIPELNTIDIPHHFTTCPLREESDEIPPDQLPRFEIADDQRVPLSSSSGHITSTSAALSHDGSIIHSVYNAANVFLSDSDPSSDGGVQVTAAAMDVFSDVNSEGGTFSTADASNYNPADIFSSPDSSPDISIGIHAMRLTTDFPLLDNHQADQVFSSSDSISVNHAADVFMSSDANSVPSPSELDSDNVAAGDIYSSECDSEDGKSNPNAAHVFTSSDSDSDNFHAAEVFHFSSDDESGVDRISTVLGEQLVDAGLMEGNNQTLSTPEATRIQTIPGPFNAQFFSNFPSSWMDPIPDEDDMDADGESIVSED